MACGPLLWAALRGSYRARGPTSRPDSARATSYNEPDGPTGGRMSLSPPSHLLKRFSLFLVVALARTVSCWLCLVVYPLLLDEILDHHLHHYGDHHRYAVSVAATAAMPPPPPSAPSPSPGRHRKLTGTGHQQRYMQWSSWIILLLARGRLFRRWQYDRKLGD